MLASNQKHFYGPRSTEFIYIRDIYIENKFLWLKIGSNFNLVEDIVIDFSLFINKQSLFLVLPSLE